jgi:hypothetical protein
MVSNISSRHHWCVFMRVNIVQVKECECAKCGYRWINRESGGDRHIPHRCAKCKRPDWELGNISRAESWCRYKLGILLQIPKCQQDGWPITIVPNLRLELFTVMSKNRAY